MAILRTPEALLCDSDDFPLSKDNACTWVQSWLVLSWPLLGPKKVPLLMFFRGAVFTPDPMKVLLFSLRSLWRTLGSPIVVVKSAPPRATFLFLDYKYIFSLLHLTSVLDLEGLSLILQAESRVLNLSSTFWNFLQMSVATCIIKCIAINTFPFISSHQYWNRFRKPLLRVAYHRISFSWVTSLTLSW